MNQPSRMICKTTFGSHLYGTQTATSDFDYKGVFLPTRKEVFLGRIPHVFSANEESTKLDYEIYSLHHFLHLAVQGQTVTIDMLFTPETGVSKNEKYGWIWDEIRRNRKLLLCKRMNAFIGYSRAQAGKYSLKGERLLRLKEFQSKLKDVLTFGEVFDILPRDDVRINPQGVPELQICGKWFGKTSSLGSVSDAVERQIKRYGVRANSAADAQGVDWKALSHAVRVTKELIEVLVYEEINFPLASAPLLLNIKQGKLSLEEVQDILDSDLETVEDLTAKSHLPDKVDSKFWDAFLCEVMEITCK